VSRTCCTVAARCTGVVIRVPDSKSMPSFRPSVEIAIAPASRMRPDIEKNQREAPMKSKCQRRVVLPGLSAQRERRMRRRLIEPRMAEVASTAVNSDTSVPTPSVNAKPLTPAVARVNRMNATNRVTAFASAIVLTAFE
jgi:hypothetical protein